MYINCVLLFFPECKDFGMICSFYFSFTLNKDIAVKYSLSPVFYI